MVSSIEASSYEELANEIKRINEESTSLKSKIYFAEMDTDLARRTVSEYAEEMVKIQNKFRLLTESIQYLCSLDGMEHSKKIDLIRLEVERALNSKEGYSIGR
ncbi:hypothetical protein [Psychrobacillus sp. FSL H8-0487]|uniref:hypothetical protein n=1 Tax=Psychrobacillus sp. FSL H8-0487 TaxID=2921391 RepID=UPI0030F643A5